MVSTLVIKRLLFFSTTVHVNIDLGMYFVSLLISNLLNINLPQCERWVKHGGVDGAAVRKRESEFQFSRLSTLYIASKCLLRCCSPEPRNSMLAF